MTVAGAEVRGRIYCSVPAYDENGTHIGSCGSFIPQGDERTQRQIAAAFGWRLEPIPLCPGHKWMAGSMDPC